ncbi:Pal1-domain-containing protein [Dothidotthia symphoricarpi CBS 119687]|uniref:Pal1-domain-containing protein n=1 Tax=Dothidotthia symphoricarpi CBS 119687 TaxID=1392245 RepID=A0A6A6A3N1_9PLEO|nr:Pal1-domain-containing protein [Dothidotthia symphoricarpi CBS 119687]KAF2125724.1 Pal1-domain-containing protein [Dothidotthia symphoricarpi CBS 119687]
MFAEPSVPERRPSPGLRLDLPSNNPFRNRASSPGLPSPHDQQRSSSASRPMSRNPFITTFEAEFNKQAARGDLIDIDMSATMRESPKRATFGTATEDLFKNLTLDDSDRQRPPQPRPAPNRSGTEPRGGHRPSRSDEEERERQRGMPSGMARPRGAPGPRPPHQSSPERRENRRPRRNSESSIVDRGNLDRDEERRRRERRRERDDRDKERKSGPRRVRKPQGLDLIDKLDVTGIYGPSMIHHDGPYDAVQPHRNRRKDQRAPMSAFPVGSANNSLGGSGPLNQKIDVEQFHGRGAEGFSDFGGTEGEWKKPAPVAEFNAKGREDILHGTQTTGLGTSTFLEGAPASRTAIQENQKTMAEGGLGRKKSIAQRFRGASQSRKYGDGPRITSPEARYGPATSPNGVYSAGPLSQTKATETNPFFNDEYDQAYDKKGAAIRTTDTEGRTGVSPPGRNGLHRTMTADSIGSPGDAKAGGGFLNRMKSLKGGRRRPA